MLIVFSKNVHPSPDVGEGKSRRTRLRGRRLKSFFADDGVIRTHRVSVVV
jgi:hypothetical protein